VEGVRGGNRAARIAEPPPSSGEALRLPPAEVADETVSRLSDGVEEARESVLMRRAGRTLSVWSLSSSGDCSFSVASAAAVGGAMQVEATGGLGIHTHTHTHTHAMEG